MAHLTSEEDVSSTRPADLRRLARGSAWNLLGNGVVAGVHLVLPIVITRRLSADDAGAFFTVTALFAMAMSVGNFGAATGVLRSLPRAKALDRRQDIPVVLRVAIIPVFLMSGIAGAAIALLAPQIAIVVVGADAPALDAFTSALYVLAPFVCVGSVYVVLVSTSRGLSSVKPMVLIESFGRSSLQVGAVTVSLLIAPSFLLAIVAWVAPYVAAILVMGLTVLRLVRQALAARPDADPPRPMREVTREFWSFTAPRAASSILAVGLRRSDILLVSAIRGLEEAAVYAAASRFLLLGLMFVQAIQQVMAPRISELLARQDVKRAHLIYETTTAWLMLVSWPIYLTSAIFAPFLLGVFGSGYVTGATAVAILCTSMLMATACGPVDTVLLMGGRSRWSMLNTGLALVVTVGVDLLLIPSYGIEGAAVGWAVGIAVNNLLPLYQVHRFLDMHPFGVATLRAAAITLVCFAGWGMAGRVLFGPTALGFVTGEVLACVSYLLCLRRYRGDLDLDALTSVVRRRRHR